MAATVGGIGQHGDSELLNHFVTISKMAATTAILKLFSCQLMLLSVDHGPSFIRMSVSNFSLFRYFHQHHIHDGCKLLSVGWSGNLVGGIGAAWRFRIAKMVLFCYLRCLHSSHLENLQITSAAKLWVWLSLTLMGGIGVLWKFRIAKIVLFQYPRWRPSWNSSNHISS